MAISFCVFGSLVRGSGGMEAFISSSRATSQGAGLPDLVSSNTLPVASPSLIAKATDGTGRQRNLVLLGGEELRSFRGNPCANQFLTLAARPRNSASSCSILVSYFILNAARIGSSSHQLIASSAHWVIVLVFGFRIHNSELGYALESPKPLVRASGFPCVTGNQFGRYGIEYQRLLDEAIEEFPP